MLLSATSFSANVTDDALDENIAETLANAVFAVGEVIVGLKSDLEVPENYQTLFPEIDIIEINSIILEVRTVLLLKLREKTRQSVFDAMEILAENSNVEYCYPNYISDCSDIAEESIANCSLNDSVVIGGIEIDLSDGYVPNDARLMDQWGMYTTEAFKAWNVTKGDGSVSVGVIDSGVSAVNDLADNVDFTRGINYVNANEQPIDEYGHGTHVAGIIGAVGDNNIGVAGVCWDVNIVPFKISTSSTQNTIFNTTSAVVAAKNMGLDILNLSISFAAWGNVPSFEEAIEEFAGLIVIGAGNDAKNLDNETYYPSRFVDKYDNVLVVGASYYNFDVNGNAISENIWENSNFGMESVHLFAPGANIISTVPKLLKYGNADYVFMSGTSMAAPHVSGAAALILSKYHYATAEQLVDAILYTVDEAGCYTERCSSGGRLNIKKAINLFEGERGSGDINMDGLVSNVDVIILSQFLENLITLNENQLVRADTKIDCVINQDDLTALAQIVVNQI